MLYMFRTILVHLQKQLYKLYIAFGICCCVAVVTYSYISVIYCNIS